MPPYHLSPDLLDATVATRCPPPRGASAAWYEARLARVTKEISTLMPANAGQARSAADIVIAREMAKTLAVQGQDPALTGPQRCRMFRVSGELERTAEGLRRGLERTQQKPAPFFGTVLAGEVDVVALADGWGKDVSQREAGGGPDGADCSTGEEVPPEGAGSAPAMTTAESDGAAEVVASVDGPEATVGRQAPESVETDARSTAEGVVTRLRQGPGWTLEAVRPRVGGVGPVPGAAV
jgi:hypothetical protein